MCQSTIAEIPELSVCHKSALYHCIIYRVVHLKWYQLTFLLVTFECPDIIRRFLLSATTVYSHTLRSITVCYCSSEGAKKQKVLERGTIQPGDCAGVVRSVPVVHWWQYRPVEASAAVCRMVDILNTNLSSLDVFSVALLFSYRR